MQKSRNQALHILLLPSYVMAVLFVLHKVGALQKLPWLSYAGMAAFYAAGFVVLALSLAALLRMKRPLKRRLLYVLLAIVLFIPYMLIPLGLFLYLAHR